MRTIIGKNGDFVVVWNCRAQDYTVYYKEKFMFQGYKFSDIKSYLD